MSVEELDQAIIQAREEDNFALIAVLEYRKSWGIRGDNTPEYATYLGYLLASELYPDLYESGELRTLDAYIQEVIDGDAEILVFE